MNNDFEHDAFNIEEANIKRNKILTEGTQEEIITFAKEYDIHQTSQSIFYTEMCNKIKARLEYYGVDPESVR